MGCHGRMQSALLGLTIKNEEKDGIESGAGRRFKFYSIQHPPCVIYWDSSLSEEFKGLED